MNLLFVIAPERFRDEELAIPEEAFREAGIGVDIASTVPGICTGMLGGTVEAVMAFGDADPDDYAGIVVVGGTGSQDHLWASAKLQALVRAFFEQGRVVAAICLAPVIAGAGRYPRRAAATVCPSPVAVQEMKGPGQTLWIYPSSLIERS